MLEFFSLEEVSITATVIGTPASHVPDRNNAACARCSPYRRSRDAHKKPRESVRAFPAGQQSQPVASASRVITHSIGNGQLDTHPGIYTRALPGKLLVSLLSSSCLPSRESRENKEAAGKQLVSLLSSCCLPPHEDTRKQISMSLSLFLYSPSHRTLLWYSSATRSRYLTRRLL